MERYFFEPHRFLLAKCFPQERELRSGGQDRSGGQEDFASIFFSRSCKIRYIKATPDVRKLPTSQVTNLSIPARPCRVWILSHIRPPQTLDLHFKITNFCSFCMCNQ